MNYKTDKPNKGKQIIRYAIIIFPVIAAGLIAFYFSISKTKPGNNPSPVSYYIDSKKGSDTNNGLSESSSWKSHTKKQIKSVELTIGLPPSVF